MHVKENFQLREIAGEWLVIAKGREALNFNATVLLNETGAFLWNLLTQGNQTQESLLESLLQEYEVDEARGRTDISNFINTLKTHNMLD